MIYALIGYWVAGLAASILLGFVAGWDGVGIWIGTAVGLAVVSVLLVGRFYRMTAQRAATAAPAI